MSPEARTRTPKPARQKPTSAAPDAAEDDAKPTCLKMPTNRAQEACILKLQQVESDRLTRKNKTLMRVQRRQVVDLAMKEFCQRRKISWPPSTPADLHRAR